jgi:hypothetical protein
LTDTHPLGSRSKIMSPVDYSEFLLCYCPVQLEAAPTGTWTHQHGFLWPKQGAQVQIQLSRRPVREHGVEVFLGFHIRKKKKKGSVWWLIANTCYILKPFWHILNIPGLAIMISAKALNMLSDKYLMTTRLSCLRIRTRFSSSLNTQGLQHSLRWINVDWMNNDSK